MARILNIETATDVCSAALFENEKCIAVSESSEEKIHSRKLTVFIEEVFKKSEKTFDELSAVAVSRGPGSFTGLRIGVSVAKGLCFALDVPLISISSLQAMAFGMMDKTGDKNSFFCPMIDAKRMEVFTAVYNSDLKMVRNESAIVLDGKIFLTLLEKQKIYFAGDGAGKCRKIYSSHPNAVFIDDCMNSAKFMGQIAFEKFQKKGFENLSSFEPVYLKDFIAKEPKKIVKSSSV